jgi:hypothetical protein
MIVYDPPRRDTMNVGASVTDKGTGYRCQWCEQPCTIEENQRGACDECAEVWDAAHRTTHAVAEAERILEERAA